MKQRHNIHSTTTVSIRKMEWKHVQRAFSSASWTLQQQQQQQQQCCFSGEMYNKCSSRRQQGREKESNTTNVTLEVDWLHEYALLRSAWLSSPCVCVCVRIWRNATVVTREHLCEHRILFHMHFLGSHSGEVLPITNISISWKPTPIEPAGYVSSPFTSTLAKVFFFSF